MAYGVANVQVEHALVGGDCSGGGSDEQIDMFLNDFGNSRGPGLPTRRLGFRRPAVALEMFEQADGFLLRAYGQASLALSPELTPTYRVCDGSVPAEAGADADHEGRLRLRVLASKSCCAAGMSFSGLETPGKPALIRNCRRFGAAVALEVQRDYRGTMCWEISPAASGRSVVPAATPTTSSKP